MDIHSASGHRMACYPHAQRRAPSFKGLQKPSVPLICRRSPVSQHLLLNRPASNLVVPRVFQAERQQVEDESNPSAAIDASQPTQGAPLSTVSEMWPRLAAEHGDKLACKEPHNREAQDLTFSQLYSMMQKCAAGMQQLGLANNDKVALIAESSSRWIIADQGAMMAGAAVAVRGSAAPSEELAYIIRHANCRGLILHDAQTLKAVAPQLSKAGMPELKFLLVIWGAVDSETEALLRQHTQAPLVGWQQLLETGSQHMAAQAWRPAHVTPDQLATLVYTSGTTGVPKGVMLTHSNLVYQVNNLSHFVEVRPGDTCLSLLPPWHIYQRSCTYYIYSCAGQLVFTSIRKFRDDLQAYPPDHLVCVPLVLDTLYTRVMARLSAAPPVRKMLAKTFMAISTVYVRARRVAEGVALQYALTAPSWWTLALASLVAALLAPLHQLGTKLVYTKVREALGVRRLIISGGGSLASHLDDFFEVLGLPVVNGWGLTETSPVLACRRVVQNVRGTVGPPVPGTDVCVVDPETLSPLGPGEKGLLLARGPGVMKGYLGDEPASAKAFRAGSGWFDTGDLGWVVPDAPHSHRMAGMVVLAGRSKDTLVLMSGKNVEPQPVEDAVCASPLIKHALLLGQDKRELGLVIFPELEVLEETLKARKGDSHTPAAATTGTPGAAPAADGGALSSYPLVRGAFQTELRDLVFPDIRRLNEARDDYTAEQHIAHVVIVTRGTLAPEDGTLTRTMKLRRAQVKEKYQAEVEALMSKLRG